MARTEKKFGQVVEPAANVNNELVASSISRRNLVINITAKSSANVSLTTWTSAPSYSLTGLAINAKEVNTQKSRIGLAPQARNQIKAIGVVPGGSSATIIMNNTTEINTGSLSVVWNALQTSASSDPISGSPYSAIYTTSPSGLTEHASYMESGKSDLGYVDLNVLVVDNQDSRNIFTSPYKMFASDLAITINCSTGTADLIGTNSLLVDFSKATNSWTSQSVSTADLPSNNNRFYSLHVVSTTDTSKQCGVAKSAVLNYNLTTAASSIIPMKIWIHKKTARGATDSGEIGYYTFSGTFNTAVGNLQHAVQAFSGFDYNEAKDVYAISHGTVSNSIGTATAASNVYAPTFPVFPSNAAPAGFRIAATTVTASNVPERFMFANNQFPNAPTGVDVPSLGASKNPSVAALKFSPDGNHLAVMYNRDYSGTGDRYSVAVIYSVDSSGNWNHTYSSGDKILYRGGSSDSMLWLPDNSGIIIISGKYGFSDTERYIQFWVPKSGTIGYVHSSSIEDLGISNYTKSPRIKSAFKVSTSTATVSGSVVSSLVDKTPGAVIMSTFVSSSTSPGRLIYCVQERTSSQSVSAQDSIRYVDITTAAIIGSSNSSAPGYINTIAQDIEMEPGKTMQISNIVLEPGESLYIESDVSDAIDAVAYGVEIS